MLPKSVFPKLQSETPNKRFHFISVLLLLVNIIYNSIKNINHLDIMLNEISHTNALSQLYVECKKNQIHRYKHRLVVARGRAGGWAKWVKGLKGTSSSHKINKFWGCNLQHGDYRQQHYIVYLKDAKTVNLKSSHHKKICSYVMWWMLSKLIVVTSLQYIYVYIKSCFIP